MNRFIDNASDDEGGFCYIERQSGALMTAYPGVIHPKIIPVGDDYFYVSIEQNHRVTAMSQIGGTDQIPSKKPLNK